MRKASTDKQQLMDKASTYKDMSTDMPNTKLIHWQPQVNMKTKWQKIKMQSGADMAVESEFVDYGRFLVNRNMPNIEIMFDTD